MGYKKKILLFLENALSLLNLQLKFLPPNTTSKTQPMDMGIIQAMKLKFRNIYLKTEQLLNSS